MKENPNDLMYVARQGPPVIGRHVLVKVIIHWLLVVMAVGVTTAWGLALIWMARG